MKKYILTVLLLISFISLYIYRNDILKNSKTEITISNEENIKENKQTINLSIYDSSKNKIIDNEVEVLNKDFLEKSDYVNLILKNSKYLKSSMRLLALYELDNNVLIILSLDFKKLSKTSFIATKSVIKKVLKENFKNLDKIEIKIEGYN